MAGRPAMQVELGFMPSLDTVGLAQDLMTAWVVRQHLQLADKHKGGNRAVCSFLNFSSMSQKGLIGFMV